QVSSDAARFRHSPAVRARLSRRPHIPSAADRNPAVRKAPTDGHGCQGCSNRLPRSPSITTSRATTSTQPLTPPAPLSHKGERGEEGRDSGSPSPLVGEGA